jgi:hypothetical protein
MKRTLILFAFFISHICFAQNSSEEIIERIDNKLYVIENDIKYDVDETIILAKLKPHRHLPNYLRGNVKDIGFGIIEIPAPDNIKVEDFVSQIKSTDDFEFVEFNTLGKYLFTPNDVQSGDQWYLDKIGAYDVWNITTGSPSVKVAILDSGVDSCHYDLHYGPDNYTHLDISNGYNYPADKTYSTPLFYHGTMVAGIVGAKTNNNIGVAGISGGNNSTGIKIIPFCVGNNAPSTNYVISAINRAIEKGAKIMNMSFSIASSEGVVNAINTAYNQGITIICASGNGNTNLYFPASYPYTIAVGATDTLNHRAILSPYQASNYGTGLDLVAPGVNIKNTILNNGYGSSSGTSFAAPQVVGVAALMLSANPSLTPSQIRSTLIGTCKKIPDYSYDNSGWNNEVGYGLLNAFSAVYNSSNHGIIGPSTFTSSGTYCITNLPNCVSVEWSLSDNYFNQNCLQQNYPSQNQCTINCSTTHDMNNATLTATIKYNGTTIQTLTKTGISQGFVGTYSSSTGSGQYFAPNPIFTGANTYVHISSPKLNGATVTYTGDAIPSYWLVGTNTIDVGMPSTGSTIVIHVICEAGDDYYIPIIKAYNSNLLSVNLDEETMLITLDEASHENQDWTLEIYNVMNGEKVVTQIISDNYVSVNTSGWKRGLYAVRATIGKEVLTEKIQVK